jgi:EpsD family peptidyl-prolyl cis-trans isomerase
MINMNNRSAVLMRAGLTALLIGVTGALLAGCEKKPAASTGQVIAHVGKEDVTAQELENEFRWTATPPDKRDDATVKRILTDIVLRKYLAQKAVGAGLDRDPAVLLDVLRSREQVLANVYVGRDVSTKATAIGKTEVENFINSQPWKFANRKILTVEQITIPLTADAQAAVEATKDLKSLDEIDQKLNELKVLHSRSMGVISSSEFSQQVLNAIEEKKNTDQFYVRTPAAGVFFKVRGEETRPLIGEAAEQIARRALVGELVRSETNTKALAAAADTEVKYEGPFVRIMGLQEPAGAKAPDGK